MRNSKQTTFKLEDDAIAAERFISPSDFKYDYLINVMVRLVKVFLIPFIPSHNPAPMTSSPNEKSSNLRSN